MIRRTPRASSSAGSRARWSPANTSCSPSTPPFPDEPPASSTQDELADLRREMDELKLAMKTARPAPAAKPKPKPRPKPR